MKDITLNLNTLLNQLETELQKTILQRQIKNPIIIGIHTGGVWIAEQMRQRLQIQEPLGIMDISFYRDDFSQIGMHPQVKPSKMPLNIKNRDIILIDDVFYTGRTIRAALNEIFDFGRPKQVILAVLIKRNGQQIPLTPDCAGTTVHLPETSRIKLTGPDPLNIEIHSLLTT